MTDEERIEKARLRYAAAAHAMQTGVKMEQALDDKQGIYPQTRSDSPKHLRVGVNSALVEHSALASLLLAKGVFTEAEYYEALAKGMEKEVMRYQRWISERMGVEIHLE